MVEIEVKIPIESRESATGRLIASGAVLDKARTAEENTLYDFPGGVLRNKQQALRLRKFGKKYFLTFKGAPQPSRKFKIRDEFETETKNGKAVKNILKSLGLQPVLSYSKIRTVFRTKKLKICLDETSAGVFLELEGKRSDIVRFAEKLGFSKKEFIKKDYIQILGISPEFKS